LTREAESERMDQPVWLFVDRHSRGPLATKTFDFITNLSTKHSTEENRTIWTLSIMAYRREVFMQMRPKRSASCCWSVQHQTADDDLTFVSKAEHVVSDWITKSRCGNRLMRFFCSRADILPGNFAHGEKVKENIKR
jgi:hypothetical protein